MTAGDDVDTVAPRREPGEDPAIAAHNARMRPLRRIYAAAVSAIVVAAAVFFVLEYEHGEIAHTTLHTVGNPPVSLAPQPPAAALGKAWTSTDTAAVGTPYYEGTVISYDRHTVRGRNALTGNQTWSYTRTDRVVCSAVQNDGVTIAVYQLHGDCDELTAVDSSTGQRKWTRTLDENGAVFQGPASYWTQPGNVLFVSRTSIYSIADENDGGLDWWTFYHPGCTINGAMLGVAGALISQTCHHEKCNGTHFCGDGEQLLLRQGEASYDDNNKTNPDQIIWNRRNVSLQPFLAGQQVAARDPATGAISLLNQKNGTAQGRLTLPGARTTSAAPAFESTIDADLIWADGRTYALKSNAPKISWQARTDTLPSVTVTGDQAASLDNSELAAASSSGIVVLDGRTGAVRHRYPAGALPANSRVYPLGAGFLVAGSSVSYYR